jgi:hypothetical protein
MQSYTDERKLLCEFFWQVPAGRREAHPSNEGKNLGNTAKLKPLID